MRGRFIRSVLTLAAGTLIAAVLPVSGASAATVKYNPHGHHRGYVASRRAANSAPTTFAGTPLLAYHGGAVMPQSTVYAIFWNDPTSGFSYPANYENIIAQYFTDVAADNGKANNPYGVMPQYTDSSGHRTNYKVTFGGKFDDADAYPTAANQCSTASDPNGNTVCIDDGSVRHEIASEVIAFASAHSLPIDTSHIYFVFFPQGTTSCDDSACAYTDYCAYHASGVVSADLLYTNQAFPENFCFSSTQTSNEANGNAADLALTAVEHEHIETLTDPDGGGWWASNGEEIGDECNFTFGTLHGTTSPRYSNLINGHQYVIQEEYSNAVGGAASAGCEQGAHVTAAFTAPSAVTGDPAAFSSSSTDTEGSDSISTFDWDFGDGSSHVTGASPSHTYVAPGTYPVTLTVTDSSGLTDFVTHNVTVTGTAVTTDPAITLHSSRNPSFLGKPVKFTAVLSAVSPATGVPTGTVTFMNGTRVLANVPLTSGVASFKTSRLGRGSHTITAVYGGDTFFNPVTSAPLIQRVRRT